MAEIEKCTSVQGVVIIHPQVHADPRGVFVETFRSEWLDSPKPMIQGNRSDKQAGALVGLHYHKNQADYWYLASGLARIVLFDLRVGSPTEGGKLSMDLKESEHLGVYIPPGVAHGFAAIADSTLTYLVDSYYNPDDELGIMWDDPDISADWGVSLPVISDRDTKNPYLTSVPKAQLPVYAL